MKEKEEGLPSCSPSKAFQLIKKLKVRGRVLSNYLSDLYLPGNYLMHQRMFLAILTFVIVLKFTVGTNSEHFTLSSGSLAYD